MINGYNFYFTIVYFFRQTSKDGNTSINTLAFVPKKEDDGKYLSCKAENKAIPSVVLEDGWKLEIHCKYHK